MEENNVTVIQPKQDVATRPEVSALTPITPMAMISQAVAQGAGIEVLERLVALEERWRANQARMAFDAAIAEARPKLPKILRTKQVSYAGKDGKAGTNYKHETLDRILEQIVPVLGEHGLTVRFRTSSKPNEPVRVTCILAHRDGHAEENELEAGRDDSGGKNAVQGIGSTVTYLQRYTLKAALGLAASDVDDDGQGGPQATITEEQAKELEPLFEAAKVDSAAWLKKKGHEKLTDIPAAAFAEVKDTLADRIKRKAGA